MIPPEAWSLPSTFEQTQVHHGYRRVVLAHLREPFGFVLEHFAPIYDAWLSWIDPGGFIVPHRDGGHYRERWQVPIHAAGELGGIHPTDGVPFRVRQWERHSVRNDTAHPRIHLVIDRDVLLPVEPMKFETYPEAMHGT